MKKGSHYRGKQTDLMQEIIASVLRHLQLQAV